MSFKAFKFIFLCLCSVPIIWAGPLACTGGTTGGGSLVTPNGAPNNAAPFSDGTLNPPGDTSGIGRDKKEKISQYQCLPGPEYTVALDQNPESTNVPTLTPANEVTSLKLLVQKKVTKTLKSLIDPKSEYTIEVWSSALTDLKDSYIRVIHVPAGKNPWEGKFRDFTITTEPQPEGFNVSFNFLSKNLKEGELRVYVRQGSTPADYSSETEKHLTPFSDPSEESYKKYVEDPEFVTYLGRFKVSPLVE